MNKCLFKALKTVNLDQHLGLFRSLGYESAGSLTQFRTEDFEKLKFTEQELLRLISLLDALKDGTNEGKFCSHQHHSSNVTRTTKKSLAIRANWTDETTERRPSPSNKAKRIGTSHSFAATRTSSISVSTTQPAPTSYLNEMIFQRPSTVIGRSPRQMPTSRFFPGKLFVNRPAVQHVKAKSYNYGILTHRRTAQRGHHANSIFVSSPRNGTHDGIAFRKPAEIYVYARKRPMLSSESNLQDSISTPDHQRIIVSENKSNLDCSPMLKKTEFHFDQVFSSDASNKFVFEQTVLPFLSIQQRVNLTYICFGQTGSGKSHTIFGSRNTDGLLVFCTQLLLREVNENNELICSFYEIYNNQVYDLNNPGKKLFVREDGNHHVNIIGITELAVRNVETLRAIIDEGLSRRHHGKSAFNSNSSRSHAVFQIALRSDDESDENFRLIFIDLAGSERATDAQNNQRQTRREGAQINCSLLALKECIRSMDMTSSHAPFRQSKLTHILRDSLIGSKTQTCLMANVSPANDCCQCSLNTLQYASRIREISLRHRHRSIPIHLISKERTEETRREPKIQQTFKPATASTPVHRLTSSVDQPIYSSIQQREVEARLTKTIDIDWQLADDDLPLTGNTENRRAKSSTRETTKNSIRLEKNHPSPSSYFPMPQTNINKTSSTKRQYNNLRLMFDNGNERHEKRIVPPPKQIDRTNISKETLERREVKKRELLGDFQPTTTNQRRSSRSNKEVEESLKSKRNERDFQQNRDNLLSIFSNRLSRSSSIATPRETPRTNPPKPTNVPKTRTLKSSSSSTTSFVHLNRSEEKKPTTNRRSPERNHPLRVQHEKNESTKNFERSLSPFAAATLNNPWLMSPTFPSPSKEFGLKVSEQLSALRNLLEARLIEHTELKSPNKTRRIELEKFDDGVDDDDDEVAQSFNQIIHQHNRSSSDEKEMPLYHPGSFSSLANELNARRVSSSLTSSVTSTITSNLAAKVETNEHQMLTSPSENEYALKFAVGTSRSESEQPSEHAVFPSPLVLPPFCQLDIENTFKDIQDQLIDSGKGSSLFTGSSFETLLNSLKTMREKAFDYPVRSSTDDQQQQQFVPVVE